MRVRYTIRAAELRAFSYASLTVYCVEGVCNVRSFYDVSFLTVIAVLTALHKYSR